MLVEPKTRADDAGQAPIVNASSPSAEDAGRQWHALLTSSKPISTRRIKGIWGPVGPKGSERLTLFLLNQCRTGRDWKAIRAKVDVDNSANMRSPSGGMPWRCCRRTGGDGTENSLTWAPRARFYQVIQRNRQASGTASMWPPPSKSRNTRRINLNDHPQQTPFSRGQTCSSYQCLT
jgi:hypothetical protein